eukprot:TCALIF_04854-PA protein Name:"Protein of unknown function" AED:0.42 eAED:0.42 QI:56/0/0/1/0/0/3/0/466
MSVIDTKESVSRYFTSVLNCLDLEDVPEVARQQDTHFLQWSSLDELLDKSQTKVRIYRADFDSRSILTQSDALSSMPNNSAPRVNTSLKPSDLDISCSLPDFRIWKKKFHDYYNSNKMDSLDLSDQRAYLRNCLTVDTINTLEQFCNVSDSMSVLDVINALEAHLISKVSIIKRRYDFHRCIQHHGENFSDFFVRLKLLGSVAELDSISYEDQLATRVVLAIADKELQQEILQMENPSLDQIKKKCQSWESGGTNQKAITNPGLSYANKISGQSTSFRGLVLSRFLVDSYQLTPKARVTISGDTGSSFEYSVLPDTGATDPVVSTLLLKDHGIVIDPRSKKRILAANGTVLKCHGSVDLQITWLDKTTTITAYATPDIMGTSVWIQNPINRLWDRIGVIEGIRNTDRSFIVNIPGGRTYVRNRRFLRPVAKIHDSTDCVQMLKQDIPNQPLRRSARSKSTPQRFGS